MIIYLKVLLGSIVALILGMIMSIVIPLILSLPIMLFFMILSFIEDFMDKLFPKEDIYKTYRYVPIKKEQSIDVNIIGDKARTIMEDKVRSKERSIYFSTKTLLKSKDEKELAHARKILRIYIPYVHHMKRQLEAGRYDVEWEDPTIDLKQ